MTPSDVERAAVCAACPAIQANVAALLERTTGIAEDVADLKAGQREIFGLIREEKREASEAHELASLASMAAE
jgi:hypothetical protein